jgi:hypothetical protein
VRVWFVTLFFLVPLWPVVPIFLGLRRRIRRAREAEVRNRKPGTWKESTDCADHADGTQGGTLGCVKTV